MHPIQWPLSARVLDVFAGLLYRAYLRCQNASVAIKVASRAAAV